MASTETTLTRSTRIAHSNEANKSSFIPIYDAYFSRVYNYVRYRCSDADTADDLTATIFEKALSNFHRYQPSRAPLGAWLFSIARNVVNEHLRGLRTRKHAHLDSLLDEPGNDSYPESVVIALQSADELLAAMEILSDRERDIISLKFAARLTNRRIAELLNLSESNVGVILYRAIKRLRTQLAINESHRAPHAKTS